ncbi:hypothetical protein BJX96DRAFT_97328 [Aspergillus floccosus]
MISRGTQWFGVCSLILTFSFSFPSSTEAFFSPSLACLLVHLFDVICVLVVHFLIPVLATCISNPFPPLLPHTPVRIPFVLRCIHLCIIFLVYAVS